MSKNSLGYLGIGIVVIIIGYFWITEIISSTRSANWSLLSRLLDNYPNGSIACIDFKGALKDKADYDEKNSTAKAFLYLMGADNNVPDSEILRSKAADCIVSLYHNIDNLNKDLSYFLLDSMFDTLFVNDILSDKIASKKFKKINQEYYNNFDLNKYVGDLSRSRSSWLSYDSGVVNYCYGVGKKLTNEGQYTLGDKANYDLLQLQEIQYCIGEFLLLSFNFKGILINQRSIPL